ncbi:hypothetical protein [Algoriphagus zhangzhouensis]|nr:hypothetical protein [Algoriphagus zhangzhouensis]
MSHFPMSIWSGVKWSLLKLAIYESKSKIGSIGSKHSGSMEDSSIGISAN